MENSSYDLIYIKSNCGCTGWEPFIPTGLIGLVNSLNYKKIGIFQNELSRKLLQQAKIAILDIHWYFSLAAVNKITQTIKSWNPNIKTIIGGYTASIFPNEINKNFPGVDYIVRGDSELPLISLVENILNKSESEINNIPNITGKNFFNPLKYITNKKDFDSLNFLNIDWFPSFIKLVERFQKSDLPSCVYPIIPIHKGCIYNCPNCLGSPDLQKKICGREKIVARSYQRVIEDIIVLNKTYPNKWIYFFSDVYLVLGKNYAEKIFGQEYQLKIFYDFIAPPSLQELDNISKCFIGGCFCFGLKRGHDYTYKFQIPEECIDIDYLEIIIQKIIKAKYIPRIYFDKVNIKLLPKRYIARIKKTLKFFPQIQFIDLSEWREPFPYPLEDPRALEEDFWKFYQKSKKVALIDKMYKLIRYPINLNQVFYHVVRKIEKKINFYIV